MIRCPECDTENPDNLPNCKTCDYFLGYPNVRFAQRSENVKTLEDRYQKAINKSKKDGCENQLKQFETEVKNSHAVINVNLDYLYDFCKHNKKLYAPYSLQVRGKGRTPADVDDDKHRRAVDAKLFGVNAEEITCAALSIDGKGLASYGQYAMKLRDVAIRKRASVLEENSFDFINNHRIVAGDRIPEGFFADWNNRDKLAVAKLCHKINHQTRDDEFSTILLFSEGNRETDEFIEVHIFGTFDNNALESVCGKSKVKSKLEQAMLNATKEYLQNLGKEWEEA